jgi:hypothetical protein
MSLSVSLGEVDHAMEGADDQSAVYLHRETGELVMIAEEDAEHVESGEEDSAYKEPLCQRRNRWGRLKLGQ